MDLKLDYPDIYWENIRHQNQLEILYKKLKNRNMDEEMEDQKEFEEPRKIHITVPSQTDAEQHRRRKTVNQQNIDNNDIYLGKKYHKQPEDQQKHTINRHNNPFSAKYLEYNESMNLQEKNKMHHKRQVFIIIVLIIFLFLLIGMATFTIYAWIQLNEMSEIKTNLIVKQQEMLQNVRKNPDNKTSHGLLDRLLGELQGHDISNQLRKLNLNIGLRNDYRLQECQGSQFKQTFPDVDYAFFGYNILRGYPLADGHDPGFTFPIFKIDYSNGDQSGDCRFSVPHGLVVIPAVSCITSFSSTIVQNKYEFSKSLSSSASASAGFGYGPFAASFSASAGFKYSTSTMATGESVFIFSTAKCTYYFSKLIPESPPPFSDVFLSWVYRLNNSDVEQDYFDFFDAYGTHFPSYILFGARFTYKHRMSSNDFQTKRSFGVNVAYEASITAKILTAGSSYSLDYSEQQTASSFSKSVETETITVGAPPPINGDPMTWASTVKDSPVPMEYKLQNIENLFSERFMRNISIDYETIGKNIKKFQYKYCNYLHSQGELNSCEGLTPGVLLEKSQLYDGFFRTRAVSSFGECVDICLQNIICEAITICKSCQYLECYMFRYTKDKLVYGREREEWQSAIFPTKIATILELTATTIIGSPRSSDKTQSINVLTECREICIEDAYCVAYTFCECPERIEQCQLYAEVGIKGFKYQSGTSTYFISPREPIANELPNSTQNPINQTTDQT